MEGFVQDITYRVPGWYNWFEYWPNRPTPTDYSSASVKRVIARTQISSGKPFPNRPLPIHPYTLIFQDYSLYRDITYTYENHTERAWGDYIALNAAGLDSYKPQVDWAYMESKALDELNEKTRGSLDLSVDIAQASQLRRMFNYTQKVEDYTRTFTRRFGVIKLASQMWLEYVYGVKPLVSSVFSVADEMIRHVINRTERFRARYSSYNLPLTAAISTSNGYQDIPVVGGSFKSSVTFGIDLESRDWDAARFSSLNPASIAWELVPYSFVVDWFLDIGGYLRNLETSLLYAHRFRGGYKTYLQTGGFGLQKKQVGGGPGFTFDGVITGNVKSTYIHRTTLNEYPAPRLPSIKATLGSSRLLSAASLLGNTLSSGGNPATVSPRLNRAVQRQARNYQPKQDVPVWERGYEHL
jgi:hypothetical protein